MSERTRQGLIVRSDKRLKAKLFTFIIIILLLLFAASIRISTFYLPHNHGDQVYYVGLAMKLKEFGLKGYNLKGIDIVGNRNILAVVPSSPGEKGTLLQGLERVNVFYYSQEELSNMPPGLSYLIMISHKLFSKNKLFLIVNNNLGPLAIFLRPKLFFVSQFYAVSINFILSLLFILLVFFLGKMLFNEKVGLWASLLIVISPVDILTSQRVWTDELVAFFTTLCVLSFWRGRTKNNLIFIGLAGVCAGMAALTKQSGVFVAFVLIAFEVLRRFQETKSFSIRIFINRDIIIFLLLMFSVCGWWYTKITLTYGAPWYMPYQAGIEKVSGWFTMLSQRPRYGQLYYFFNLLPLFILFYFEMIRTLLRRLFTPERILCMLWFFLFVIFLMLIPAKEERYLLPAYPAIAMFSGIVIENIRMGLNKFKKIRYAGDILIIAAFFVTSHWSVPLGMDCVFNNLAIFR